jgi:chromosome segregation ATPase
MTKLEDELKEARNQAEEADKKYDEVAKKLAQVRQCCQLAAEIHAEKSGVTTKISAAEPNPRPNFLQI